MIKQINTKKETKGHKIIEKKDYFFNIVET